MKSRVLVALLLGVALALGIFFGAGVPHFFGGTSSTPLYNTATIIRQVQTLSELVTVKYVMEKVIIFEDVKWYGESRVMIVAHGIVKAGVDLSNLKATDLRINGTRIRINLPPEKITDVYLDDKATQVIERSTGLLRQFDKDLEQNARSQAVDDIRRGARMNGILKEARERAQGQLTRLFKESGFTEVEFSSK